jgi:hypothetical protein
VIYQSEDPSRKSLLSSKSSSFYGKGDWQLAIVKTNNKESKSSYSSNKEGLIC